MSNVELGAARKAIPAWESMLVTCPNHLREEAQFYCVDCQTLLCAQCLVYGSSAEEDAKVKTTKDAKMMGMDFRQKVDTTPSTTIINKLDSSAHTFTQNNNSLLLLLLLRRDMTGGKF